MKRLFPVLLLALLLFGSLQDRARAASTPPEKTASGSPGENPNKHATFNPVLTIQLQRDAAMWGEGTVLDVDIGPNLYAYVRQNPWTKFDPLGLKTIEDYEKLKQKQVDKVKKKIENGENADAAKLEALIANTYYNKKIQDIEKTAKKINKHAKKHGLQTVDQSLLNDEDPVYLLARKAVSLEKQWKIMIVTGGFGAVRSSVRSAAGVNLIRSRGIATDTVGVNAGVGKDAWVSPATLRFSQRTISPNNYQQLMEQGKWKWSASNPLIVIQRPNGKLVSLDNRRLAAAQQANVRSVPIRILKPSDKYRDYKTIRTAQQAFNVRSNHPNTLANGGQIPKDGLSTLPTVVQ